MKHSHNVKGYPVKKPHGNRFVLAHGSEWCMKWVCFTLASEILPFLRQPQNQQRLKDKHSFLRKELQYGIWMQLQHRDETEFLTNPPPHTYIVSNTHPDSRVSHPPLLNTGKKLCRITCKQDKKIIINWDRWKCHKMKKKFNFLKTGMYKAGNLRPPLRLSCLLDNPLLVLHGAYDVLCSNSVPKPFGGKAK